MDNSRGQDALETEQDRGWPAWGREIQAALDRHGITVNSAATRLGLRNTTLKRWLAGEVPPQLSRLGQIAALTGVSSEARSDWLPMRSGALLNSPSQTRARAWPAYSSLTARFLCR